MRRSVFAAPFIVRRLALALAALAAPALAAPALADGPDPDPLPSRQPQAHQPHHAVALCASGVVCDGVWIVDDRPVALSSTARREASFAQTPQAIHLRDDFVKALDGGVGPACNGCCDYGAGRGVVVVSGGRKTGFSGGGFRGRAH